MTKSWAKPYLRILKDHLSSWEKTHSPPGETKVAQLVVKAIEQLRDEEEIEGDLPDNLDKVSTGTGTPRA
jgi:hypothetical protein